ncbi:MAG TPA: CinA family protein [Pseudoclavibacter sp.]|nr:CinA family protein [Pseudoclavibacter sp.]
MYLQERIVRALKTHSLRVAVAESLTGGLLMAAFTDVPGASAVFQGGIVAYQTSLKHRLLGVDEHVLNTQGAVCADTAEQMALGVRERLAEGALVSTLGLSTTGVAGPDWQDDQPPGTVFIGLATQSGVHSFEHAFSGGRQEIREATVQAALEHLRDYLHL